MTTTGTAAYDGRRDLPPLVEAAVAAARAAGFANSCLPEQGQLLRVLAGGVGDGAIAETGTGCGVGLAWLASGARAGTRLVSIERDPARASVAAGVFAGEPRVSVRTGDWRDLLDSAPYDLLVLDGGGQGKGEEAPLDPSVWLRPGGLVVVDDFTPMTSWPPVHCGQLDVARQYWLEHPRLRTAEIRLTPEMASIVGTYLG
jgi:predicted O-methyltransferase YrrM